MKKAVIVGFGFMGMTHATNILKINKLKLVAIVERDLSVIENNLKASIGNIDTGNINKEKLADVKRYTDLDECLSKEAPDAVFVCTHVNTHYEIALKALENNAGVFIEKPFFLDPLKAQKIIDLAESKRKILMVGHVVRFMQPYLMLKRWIDEKEFGDLRFLSLTRLCGLPGWGQWNEDDVKDLSGGALFDLAIHDIDFAYSILGLPSQIQCNYLAGHYSKHDYISAMWSYNENNVHVKIEGGFTFHKSFPFQAGYVAQFRDASVMYNTFKGDVIKIADDNTMREVSAGDAGEGYFNEMVYFTDCLLNGIEPVLCSSSSSLEAIKLCYKHL